jgi:hypothetical protein
MSRVLGNEEYNRPSTLRVVKTFIESMAFDVAAEDPMVAVMVVVFSAALLRITNINALCVFTGYSHQFVSAIADNMQSNDLWRGENYEASYWLRDRAFDEHEFLEQVDVACGTVFCRDQAYETRSDPLNLVP